MPRSPGRSAPCGGYCGWWLNLEARRRLPRCRVARGGRGLVRRLGCCCAGRIRRRLIFRERAATTGAFRSVWGLVGQENQKGCAQIHFHQCGEKIDHVPFSPLCSTTESRLRLTPVAHCASVRLASVVSFAAGHVTISGRSSSWACVGDGRAQLL